MQFTPQELSLINSALTVTPEDRAKTFIGVELVTATDIFRKLRPCIDVENKVFIASDLELTTEEKALMIKVMDRAWSPAQGDVYLPLKGKLNA